MSGPVLPADSRLARVVTWMAAASAVVIAVLLPGGYFGLRYGALAAAVQARAEAKAQAVTHLITLNPELWMFQTTRLMELVAARREDSGTERVRVRDATGSVVVETGTLPAGGALARAVDLYDAGTQVGRVEVAHSIRALLAGTALVALLGLLVGGGAFATLRVLPLRALRRATAALFEEKQRAEITLHSIGDGVITTDAAEIIAYLNPVAEKLTGWTLAEARGRPLSEVLRLIHEDTLEPAESPLRSAIAESRIVSFPGHTALVRRDESTIAVEDSAAPIRSEAGAVIGGVLVFHDVSAARSMAQRLSWHATHDALTGLVNRREFETRVDAAIASARNLGKHHIVLYLDLDQFKVVNDTSGHPAGDELLRQIAAQLQARIRESDTLARLGGDEFGVLLDGCPLDRAQLIASDLLAAVRDHRFAWESKVYTVGVSIGLVRITAESGDRAEVLSRADAACYSAKEQGRNRVYVFRTSDTEVADRRREMDWVSRLHRALAENRFTLYHQSYLRLEQHQGRERHIEVLLRLIDEDGAVVPPGSFLPAAERYNVMPEIDRWVIRNVFASYRSLKTRLGGGPLMCAVNISGTSLNSEGFFEYIRDQAATNELPPEAICFEITETAAINNLRRVAQFMKDMKALGFRFALDDFGTGTSSFGYLRTLPVDYLKIDGSFVRDIAHDPMDKAMAETINRIGHIMGMKTVAEFAESDAVVTELKSMGVDFAQGFAIQKPQPLPLLAAAADEPAAPVASRR